MLLSTRVVESIRAEQHLILSLIVGASILGRSPILLPIATTSHDHWRLASGDTWTQLLPLSVLVILVDLIISTCNTLMRVVIRWWLLIWVFTHDRATYWSVLIDHLVRRILTMMIVVLRRWATVMCSMISSISTIPLISLTSLISSIEILTGASILRHIKCIFNARRPLALSVSHGEMRVSVAQIRLRTLIRLSLIVLAVLILSRWRSSSHSGSLSSSNLFLSNSSRSFFIEDLRLFIIWLSSSLASITSSSVLTFHLFVHPLVIIHLVFDPWLHMLILFSRLYSTSSRPHLIHVHPLVSIDPCSLRPRPTGSQLGHLDPMTLSIRLRHVIEPWFLMSLPRGTVTHHHSPICPLSANYTIRSPSTLILILIVDIFIVSCLRRRPSMLLMVLLVVLRVISRLLRDRIVGVPVVLSRRDWWIPCVLLVLALQMLGILGWECISVMTAHITIHFCLTWWASIWHWNVVGTWSCISHRAVFGSILRARVGIRGAATCSASVVRWHICSSRLSPVAMILRRINDLRRRDLLDLHLLACFLKSSFKAIFHCISSLTSRFLSVNSSDVNLRSLFPHYSLIEILVVVSPPLRIDKGIQGCRSRFQSYLGISLSKQEIPTVHWGIVWGFSFSPLRRWLGNNLNSRTAASGYCSGLFRRTIFDLKSWRSYSGRRRRWIRHGGWIRRQIWFYHRCDG